IPDDLLEEAYEALFVEPGERHGLDAVLENLRVHSEADDEGLATALAPFTPMEDQILPLHVPLVDVPLELRLREQAGRIALPAQRPVLLAQGARDLPLRPQHVRIFEVVVLPLRGLRHRAPLADRLRRREGRLHPHPGVREIGRLGLAVSCEQGGHRIWRRGSDWVGHGLPMLSRPDSSLSFERASASLEGSSLSLERSSLSLERSSLSLERASLSLERASVSLERASVSLERASVSLERASVSLEGSSVSLERSSLSIERSSLSLERSSLSLERSSLSLERSSLSLERASLSLERASLSLERASVSLERASLSLERS